MKTHKQIFFFVFRLCFSFKNNRRTNVHLVSIFENTLKKSYLSKTPFRPFLAKRPKWRFWWLIAFFSAFSKILTKRTFVHLLFSNLNQSPNTENKFFGVFSSKTKNALFRGSKMVIFKTQISHLYFSVCCLMQKEALCRFSQKNINI